MDSSRVFANLASAPGARFGPHHQRVIERASNERSILLMSETVGITPDADDDADSDGSARRQPAQDIDVHLTLAVSGGGVPLGVTDVDTRARGRRPSAKRAGRARTSHTPDQQTLWSLRDLKAGLQLKRELLDQSTAVTLVQVWNGEPLPLLREADDVRSELKVVALAPQNQVLGTGGPKLWDLVESLPIMGETTVAVPLRTSRPARQAGLQLRWTTVSFDQDPVANDAGQPGRPRHFGAILAEEPPAKGVGQPIRWHLLTTRAVHTPDDAAACVRDFGQRSVIESYANLMKRESAFEAEDCETPDVLQKVGRDEAVIAWTLLFLVTVGRAEPNRPCTDVFSDDEWRVVSLVQGGVRPGKKPPTLAQMAWWVGEMGGHKGGPGDRPPGAASLRSGLDQLPAGVAVWRARGSGKLR